MTSTNQHLFALHVPNFWSSASAVGTTKKIDSFDLVHRLVTVLRSQLQDQYVFFDRMHHGVVQIVEISKKNITVQILTMHAAVPASQHTTFLLPLLKKEALEEAVYSLSEIGVSSIQLVVTQKSRQKLLHAKEFQRLQAIVISAAEQSKNYAYPDLAEPQQLTSVIQSLQHSSMRILFDGTGSSFMDISAQKSLHSNMVALIGPEGGLTHEEVSLVHQHSFVSYRLTDTTLRALQAAAIGAAILVMK